MKDLIESIKEKGLDILGAEEEDLAKYKEAVPIVMEGLESAKGLLKAFEDGDKEAFNERLTEWEDVNRTLEAIHKMDNAIEESKNGVTLNEVLEIVGKVVKVVVTIGALA
jgi:hypothetical protein